MAVALAFGAAAAAVVGVWELLAAVERTRVAAAWRRAVAPIVRAGREGVSPTVAERRRLGVLAAAALAAAGWFVAGVGRGDRRRRRPARRSRWRSCARGGDGSGPRWPRPRRSSPAPSPTRCRPATPSAARWRSSPSSVPGAAGHELGKAGAGAAPRRPDRERAGAAAPARGLAGLGRDDRRHPAPARRGRRPARAPARPRARARGRRAPGPRRARGDRAGALHRADRARPARSARPSSPSSPSPACCSGLLTNPISAWLTCLALLLQLIALVAVRRLTRNVVR